ncbi:NAD-dependent epimerase/dehydratase family protein [Streptomyces griseus]|uniref:NAD-dependent epimerase/dehydratase family protein n=1 Tax=Streptomyces griseus TaxID=1911 RepID=UPI0036BC2423
MGGGPARSPRQASVLRSVNGPGATGNRGGTAPRSVVVLGGGGFLGRHIGSAFRRAGARTLSVSRNAPASAASRAAALDLSTAPPERLAEILTAERADVLVNAVGRVWGASDAEMEDANARLVRRLADCLAAMERPPRLIQLGSIHEYGPGTPGSALAEEGEARPDTAYGRTKLLGTHTVLDAVNAHPQVEGVVLRVANALGPGVPRGSLFGAVAHRLADAARRPAVAPEPVVGMDAEHPAPGTVVLTMPALRVCRDFVDVRDVADAVVAAATVTATEVSGRIVNIGSGRPVLVRQLVERLVAMSGLSVRIDPAGESGGAGGGAALWQQLDISLAHKLLDWSPRRDPDESLRDLLAAA